MTTILLAMYFSMNLALVTKAIVNEYTIFKHRKGYDNKMISFLSFLIISLVGFLMFLTVKIKGLSDD